MSDTAQGANNAPPPPKPSSANPKLPEAVEDAQLLLCFASQSGVQLDDSVVKTIVDTSRAVHAEQVSSQAEHEFWIALRQLAKKLEPVSVSSLRATMDSQAQGKTQLWRFNFSRGSLARRAVNAYTYLALIALVLLLLFQIYWLFGGAITGDIQRLNREIAETETKMRSLQRTQSSSDRANELRSSAGASTLPEVDITALREQIENLVFRKDVAYDMLALWSSPWRRTEKPEESVPPANTNIARFQVAVIVLEILQRYFLPLLYGLLGTCVYVLRTLTAEIRGRTYSEASNIGFRIRLYLGTLGGIVVAWFITPDTADGVLKSLSPFALAFIAGYSIELVFAAMDRMISAFSDKAPKGEPA